MLMEVFRLPKRVFLNKGKALNIFKTSNFISEHDSDLYQRGYLLCCFVAPRTQVRNRFHSKLASEML